MTNVLLEPRNDLTDLPKPGDIVIYDYCDGKHKLEEADECLSGREGEEFRVKAVQWNIERAYKLDEIIELLTKESTGFKDHRTSYKSSELHRKKRPDVGACVADLKYKDFDVMAIQEFDINCARSNYRNSAQELARALKMRCIFLCEFEEIYSEKLRNRRSQGGGVHGNGILTWWDVERVEVIEHVEIFDWERDGERLKEPRRGKRSSLACFLKHPLYPDRRMIVYSVHLEVFCGIFGRLRQFSQILEHSRRNISTHPLQMILGDLNTMAHGLARLLPKYCCDVMRWRSVGWSEAEWWQRNLFAVTPNLEVKFNHFLAAHHHPRKPRDVLKNSVEIEQEIEREIECEDDKCAGECGGCLNTADNTNNNTSSASNNNITTTTTTGNCIFTNTELQNLINPFFFCPFPVSLSKTVQMHGYSGKLDWMLLRGWRVINFGFDNELYGRSDHKLLWCEVTQYRGDAEDCGKLAHDHFWSLKSKPKEPSERSKSLIFDRRILFTAGAVGLTGILIYYLSIKE